jgi:recombination protein RecT
MKSNSIVLPLNRLPSGYAHTLRHPTDPPVTPRPAATLALLRGTEEGLEVLLLKRGNQTRFIPGAFVFPGGRVDEEDHATDGGAFRAAALRETFEEAGILIGQEESLSFPLEGEGTGPRLRRALLREECSFGHVLEELGLTSDPGLLTQIGHWVTPTPEAYRFDTLFFGVEVPSGCRSYPDGTELVESSWIAPSEALRLNGEGRLPMVFPTLHTLQELTAFSDPGEALESLGQRRIPRLLPQVEETGDGVRMTLELPKP